MDREERAVREATMYVFMLLVVLVAGAVGLSLPHHSVVQVLIICGLVLAFVVAGLLVCWAFRKRGLVPWHNHLSHVVTEVQVAVLLAGCLGMAAYIVVETAAEHQGEKSLHIAMEAWIAGAVALVTFTFLSILKAASLVQRSLQIEETGRRLEASSKELAKTVDDVSLLGRHGNAASALAAILQLHHLRDDYWRSSGAGLPQTRAAEIDTLAAFGRNAEYWLKWAAPSGSELGNQLKLAELRVVGEGGDRRATTRTSPEQGLLRLTLAEQFAGEMASDIANPSRIVVSNIRFVTRAVTAAHFTMRDLAMRRGTEELWVPAWLVFTSYEPSLWAEPMPALQMPPHFPQHAAFLQYWGRYLRQVEHIAQLDCYGTLKPINARVFVSHNVNNLVRSLNDDTRRGLFFDGEQFGHLGPRTRDIREAGEMIALRLALDAAERLKSVRQTNVELLDGWGPLGSCVLELQNLRERAESQGSGPLLTENRQFREAGLELLENLVRTLDGNAIGDAMRRSYQWELEYYSAVPQPTIPAQALAELDHRLHWIEGSPLEVILDALLLTREAIQPNVSDWVPLGRYLLDRWHNGGGRLSGAFHTSRGVQGTEPFDQLAGSMPVDGDVHFFGLAPVTEEGLLRGKIEWLEGFVAAMHGRLSIARLDFLEIREDDKVDLLEVRRAAALEDVGAGDLVSLNAVFESLSKRGGSIESFADAVTPESVGR